MTLPPRLVQQDDARKWEMVVSDFRPSTEYVLEAGFHQQVK